MSVSVVATKRVPRPKPALTWHNPDGTEIHAYVEPTPANEQNTLIGGTPIRTHASDKCYGYWCCIHNPSPHHMRSWKQEWNGRAVLMLRVCSHGVGHPDPDDPNAFKYAVAHRLICDGCCKPHEHIKRGKAK